MKPLDERLLMEALNDLDANATPDVEAGSAVPPPFDGHHRYIAFEGSLYYYRGTREGQCVWVRVTNFEAVIVEDRTEDDGAAQNHVFKIDATLNEQKHSIDVSARDFGTMAWVAEKLGASAIVYPNLAQHARAGIQELSGTRIRKSKRYGHTGWTSIAGRSYYLHAGGALGAEGNRTDVLTGLDQTLPLYRLPDPPTDAQERRLAIRASLDVLDVAPDRLTVPVLASVYRAPLGPATFSLHINGVSGQGKSQLAALAQQHFGPAMDSYHLPAAWQSTGGANVTLAFLAKDAILVVDDFVLGGSTMIDQRLHGEAEKLLRAQGNLAARRTLTTETKLRPDRSPRGLIVSTGEHNPRGSSLNARLVNLPFNKAAMDWQRLDKCQADAMQGRLATALACYIQWLAPQLQERRQAMEEAKLAQRHTARLLPAAHMRTPDNLESLRFGFNTFASFALEEGAISESEHYALLDRIDRALMEVGIHDGNKHGENDPARQFIAQVNTALLMRRCHLVAAPNGGRPTGENPWGWPPREGSVDWLPSSPPIGWIGHENGIELVYLDPSAAFTVASRLASESASSLPGTVETIKRDLAEHGYLHQTDSNTKRRTITVRRKLLGEYREVLIIAKEKLSGPSNGADIADATDIKLLSEFRQGNEASSEEESIEVNVGRAGL